MNFQAYAASGTKKESGLFKEILNTIKLRTIEVTRI